MKRYHYGTHPDQFGDLYRPDSSERLPVMVILHGGYWKDNHSLDSYATIAIVKHFAANRQVAIWNLEYRRMESEGTNTKAPWPAILSDVSDGVDFLRQIQLTENLDISKIVVVGHSAGGHLSAWLSSRACITEDSELYRPDPLLPNRAVVLAGILDFSSAQILSQPSQVERFIGGKHQDYPGRYAESDPLHIRDSSIPMTILHGIEDADVPVSQTHNYTAKHKGENIRFEELSGCDHFGMLPLEDIIPKHWEILTQILEQEINMLNQ
jgi:acetyl esterase/lipase